VLYQLVGPHGGTVVGIEHVSALTALAESNMRADGLGAALDRQAVVLVTGDGRLGASLFRVLATTLMGWCRVPRDGPL
jgi:hypothetical protein